LERAGYRGVERIGSLGERDILRMTRVGGTPCYANGKRGAAWPIGRYVCQNGPSPFPSAEHPVLDFSLATMAAGEPRPHYEQVSGVASDGVEAINVLDAEGAVLVRLTVVNNLYGADVSSLGDRAVELQAVDATGAVVATMPG
jgi:hypothetical protein